MHIFKVLVVGSLVLQASGDQSVLSPVRQVTRELNQPICKLLRKLNVTYLERRFIQVNQCAR